ncbi:MAG: hypothetical protein AB1757_06080 [Acidobacteriota bacterium]
MLQISIVFISLMMLLNANSTFRFSSPIERRALGEKGLVLTAVVLRVRLNQDDDKIHSRLRLKVRFKLENTQDHAVLIVPGAVKVVGIRLAQSIADFEAEKLLYHQEHYPSFKQKDLMGKLPDSPSSRVKVLSSQSSWEWTTDYQIVLKDDNEKDWMVPHQELNAVAKKKEVWGGFIVMFWPSTMTEEGVKVSSRWKNYGELVVESLTSKPAPFAIPPRGEK